MVQPRQNRNRDDALAAGNLMAIWRGLVLIARQPRNARAKTGMRAAPIVMNHPFLERGTEMPFTEGDQPVQTFSTDRAHQTLAECVRLLCAVVIRTVRSIASTALSTATEKRQSRS